MQPDLVIDWKSVKARVKARLQELDKTQRQLADSMGIGWSRLSETLKGTRRLQPQEGFDMADFLGFPANEIFALFGIVWRDGQYGRLPIRGLVDATSGAVIMRADVDSGDLEEIDAPFPGYKGCAVRIRGSSMTPRYREGEIIGYTRDSTDIAKLLNEEVVAELSDGRLLLKVLHRGSEPGLYSLVSINPTEPPVIDVEISWAAALDFHLPRRA